MTSLDYSLLEGPAPSSRVAIRKLPAFLGLSFLGLTAWLASQTSRVFMSRSTPDNKSVPVVPLRGVNEVLAKPMPPGALQVLPSHVSAETSALFLYTSAQSEALTNRAHLEEGWVYGAKLCEEKRCLGLAEPTGQPMNILKGVLLTSDSIAEQLQQADKLLGYDPSQPDKGFLRRGVVAVVRKDGSTVQSHWYFRGYEAGEVVISGDFDSGNIKVVDSRDVRNIRLKIRPEPFTEGTDKRSHFQWFNFKAAHVAGKKCSFHIVNAGNSSYATAWSGYNVAYSYDPSAAHPVWKRTKATYHASEGRLSWDFTSQEQNVWFAYFAAYPYSRHEQFMASLSSSPLLSVSSIGRSLEGRPMTLVRAGSGPRSVWLIGRQHPGETMASWWMEGALKRLADPADTAMAQLRKQATVYVVPLMCPDGAARGHLRTNARGSNLNREWASDPVRYGDYKAPTRERSPEVECVLAEMHRSGVDVFMDVHGDEEIPDNFFAGAQGSLHWGPRAADLFVYLSGRALAHSKDFQIGRGYGQGAPTYQTQNFVGNPTTASDAVANAFHAVSVVLEMPFKDAEVNPQPETGWSAERSAQLGRAMLSAVLDVLPQLGPGELSAQAKAEVAEVKQRHPGSYWWDLQPPPATASPKAKGKSSAGVAKAATLAEKTVTAATDELNLRESPVIIDVQTGAERVDPDSTVADALHLEWDMNTKERFVAEEWEVVAALPEDKSRALLTYCKTGKRAEMAKQFLERLGFTNVQNGKTAANILAQRRKLWLNSE